MLFSSDLPSWLDHLLQEQFFTPCSIHEYSKKNERNIFCMDCCTSVCTHCCLSLHQSHRLFKVRRYVYHDVLRLVDAQKLMDCSFVQAYSNNRAKVVFIHKRPQSRPFRGSGSYCSTCDRSLQDPFRFCSVSCKIESIVRRKGGTGLSKYLYECKFMQLPEPGSEDGQMTPDPVLEACGSLPASSCSRGNVGFCCKAPMCIATKDVVVRKKRSSISVNRFLCRSVVSTVAEVSTGLMNRRKGTPHRSPMY